jgi:hypothetical protein
MDTISALSRLGGSTDYSWAMLTRLYIDMCIRARMKEITEKSVKVR